MNNHLTINDLLDQWVKNEITFDELAFRSGKEDLSELQENMEMHRLAVHAIQKHATARQVASIHQKYLDKRTKEQALPPVQVVSINRSRLAVKFASAAAVLAALLVAAQMLFVSSNRIYSEAFTEYFANNERSATAPIVNNISQMFQKGDYNGVLASFEAGKVNGEKEIFLAGYSALVLKDYNTATKYFTSIIDKSAINNNTLFVDEAEYYLALTTLRAGKHEEAYRLMKSIHSNSEHTYNSVFDKWTLLRMRWIK